MHYIYDIMANFNNIFYDFYDWNDSDSIVHIKKLPILKVDSDFYNSVKFYDVVVDKTLIDKIYRKTDFFSVSKNKYNYVCCLCDGREAFIVNFNSKGCVVGRSSMLIDEENEVVDICECMSVYKIDFVVNNMVVPSFFKTRYESYINQFFLNELNCLSNDELCYLYFDCFDECETDSSKIIERISNEFDVNFEFVSSKISDFLGLISINK